MMTRMLLFAALLALAAPLRAGEAAWINSADHEHVAQLPADWVSVPAVPGLSPRGVSNVFTLAPKSRAFVLDVAAEFTLAPNYVSTEEYFTRARKRAGNPPALRAPLADYSLFEYFSSTYPVKGRAVYRLQGVLHKYLQRYYLTFNSARGYPGDKDWKAALPLLASLEHGGASIGDWKQDFLEKVSGGPALALGHASTDGSLKYTAVANADGTGVRFEEIALFGCKNFGGNQYLFNMDRTAHCWIVTMDDYKAVLAVLDAKYWDEITPVFQACPAAMRQERACDIAKLRNF